MSMLDVKSTRDSDAIAAEAATEGGFTHQLPLTRDGWETVANATCGDDVILTAADGTVLLGTVQDTDEGKYQLFIELR